MAQPLTEIVGELVITGTTQGHRMQRNVYNYDTVQDMYYLPLEILIPESDCSVIGRCQFFEP